MVRYGVGDGRTECWSVGDIYARAFYMQNPHKSSEYHVVREVQSAFPLPQRQATATRLISYTMLLLMTALLSVITRNPLSAADDTPTFHTGRGVSLYLPFMEVVRARKNGPPSPPYYGSWSATQAQQVPAQLKNAGFDLVRLSVSPVPLLDAEDEPDRQTMYSQFAGAIDDILKANLNIVFDLHVTDGDAPWDNKTLTADLDGPHFRAYVKMVSSVAQFLSRYDASKVAFEPFNEPPAPCNWWSGRWPAFQKKLLVAVRAAAPKLTLILTGACWGSLDGLQELRSSDYDANTIYTFHYYEPFLFTHQGAWFTSLYVRYLSRVPYPPTVDRTDEFLATVKQRIATDTAVDEEGKAKIVSEASKYLRIYFGQRQDRDFIQRQVSIASRWAERNRVSPQRIWVGEFGALGDVYGYQAAAPEDRQRWLSDARSVFEQFGFGWAVWNYCCAMGIIKGETSGPLDPGIVHALGLRPSGPS